MLLSLQEIYCINSISICVEESPIDEEGWLPVCPKSGYELQPKDDGFALRTEWPKCGVIYAKALRVWEENQYGQNFGGGGGS